MSQVISGSFADLTSPISQEKFQADYLGKSHLFMEGSDNKFEGVTSWDAIAWFVS